MTHSEEKVDKDFVVSDDVVRDFLNFAEKDSIEFEEFGIDLEEYLFQIPNPIYCNLIFDKVVRGIKEFIPSVKIDFSNSKVFINETNDKEYILVLVVQTKMGSNIQIKESLGRDMTY
jgi:phage baseplate assembly protein W